MLGQTILHYQLLEAIGAGGMGQIYKAEDTRLHRIVALKVLPPGLAADPDRRQRFLQEAQAASALNHPNIVTLFDIVTDGETQCIVMEYVPGNTLRAVIPPGGLAVSQALQYATQIASALAAAHAAGIIHRDLKPSNIMVTPTGMVKILDFGLAKWVSPAPSSEQPTIEQAQLTKEGSIIGTVSYMSPEQAEGKRVDARSDIFSFGSVMYEMVTGRRAFEGTSGISTLSAILRDEVKPIYELAPEVPPLLEQVILRCLPKDPDARWTSMKQIESALITLQRQLDPSGTYAPPFAPSSSEPSAIHAAAPTPAAPPSRSPGRAPAAAAAPPAAPSSKSTTTAKAVPAASAPAPAAAKRAKSSILVPVLLLVGVLLIASAGAGAWLWWKNQHRPAPPFQAEVVAPPPTSTEAPAATPAPENPPPEAAPATPPPDATQAPPAETTTPKAPRKPATKKSPAPAPAQLAPIPPPAATPQPKVEEPPTLPPPKPVVPKTAPVVLTPVTVNDALPFRIALAQDVAADTPEGQSLAFTVLDDFQVGGKTLIAKGARVTGVVTGESGKKKFLGMGGSKMRFELQRADAVDSKKINVRAMAGRAKEGPTTRPFDTGKGSKPKGLAAVQGTEYIAYIDGDQVVSVRK